MKNSTPSWPSGDGKANQRESAANRRRMSMQCAVHPRGHRTGKLSGCPIGTGQEQLGGYLPDTKPRLRPLLGHLPC